MKVGDLVKWIGFPDGILRIDGTTTRKPFKENAFGIIVKIHHENRKILSRVDVLWGPGGRIGRQLYPETLEVINSPCKKVGF